VFQRLLQDSRLRLAVLAAVVLVLALSGTLLVLNGLSAMGSHLSNNPPSAAVAAQATGTGTATSTLTPRPTATQRPKSQAKQHVNPPAPPVPTPPPAATPCPTPTSLPKPTATDTPASTATDTPATGLRTGGGILAMAAACQPCPYYKGNNPSQSAIRSALNTAADAYGLPRNLLLAVAWQESRWHEDVTSCDGGIGLMQIQYYTYPWLNGQSVSACGLGATSYDPYTLQGNAYLGAKFLKWLSCFYSYWGNNGGTSPSSPGQYTIAWYYQQAGLRYPDIKNADGSTNPNSLCAAVFNDSQNPEYAALPSTTAQPWSCPYSATAGDNTLLDATLSAYNEGPGTFNESGVLNPGYVAGVERFIPQFASGALP
jgi:soluble lytic murein transglycosylase-like protein